MASEGMIGQGLSDMKLKTILTHIEREKERKEGEREREREREREQRMGGRGSEWEYNKDFL